ncbi:MAG: PepSY domain-containing protein [Yoonia sp.]|uniref:PepSY domain-containing protein n=1 Tax=Yoonia sp. TaxID=2212373 RepID=UPI003EF3BFB7
MRFLVVLVSAVTFAAQAHADARELSQHELRAAVSEGRAVRTQALITGVERYTGGEALEVRAFLEDQGVIYRVLYRTESGSVATLMVDASTGRSVSPSSTRGQSVESYAASHPEGGGGVAQIPTSASQSESASSNNLQGNNGNSNSGNGGGNSGNGNSGNGNGNGGGNSGNGNGNGGGNSGNGNGGGNSGNGNGGGNSGNGGGNSGNKGGNSGGNGRNK